MLFGNKIQANFEVPGEPTGGATPVATPSAPVEPPSNPTDPNPEAISSSDEWVLGQFDAMRADDASEDIDIVEPVAPIPVSPQGENPDPAMPGSPQTGEAPKPLAALATPVPVVSAQPPPVPVVGASANQPVSPAPLAQTSAPDPTSIMAQIAEGIQQQKAAFVEHLAKQYLMSEKEADELGFTPEQVRYFARMKAEAQIEATVSIARMQAEQLPGVVNGIANARSENQRREDEFFGQWPALRAAPKDSLAKIFQAVNQLHPDLKGGDWSRKAGEMAHVSLGIPVQQVAASTPQGNQPQTIRTPGPIVRQTNGLMHLPAGTSTAPAPVAPQMSESERFFRLLQQTDAGDFEG